MKVAIVVLENALEVAETNEPINRANGNVEQADLEAKNASVLRQAIAILQDVDRGGIWPKPTERNAI